MFTDNCWVIAHPVEVSEETRFQQLMRSHHYLGSLPKIGNTLWYVATWSGELNMWRRSFLSLRNMWLLSSDFAEHKKRAQGTQKIIKP